MKKLRQLREARGWTQLDLALRLGVAINTVGKWERGVLVPSEANRYRLMVLFTSTPPHMPSEPPVGPPPEAHFSGGNMAGVG